MRLARILFFSLVIVANSFANSFRVDSPARSTPVSRIGESIPTHIAAEQQGEEQNQDFNFLRVMGVTYSTLAIICGLLTVFIGAAEIGNDAYNQNDAKLALGIGAGAAVLGVTGIILLVEW